MAECERVLNAEKRGALAVNGDEGYPYVLPINYYYDAPSSRLYFHCAGAGHKFESIQKDPKVSFTVWEKGEQREDWSYFVKSIIVFGKAGFLKQETEDEKAYFTEILEKLGCKYYPTREEVLEEIRIDAHRVQVMYIEIEHMCGKIVHEK